MSTADFHRWLGWFIRLRWLAAAGVLGVILGVRFALGIPLEALGKLCLCGGILFVYNCVFLGIHRHNLARGASVPAGPRYARIFSNVQITLDLLTLLCLLHFAGSLENPFVVFLVFHMVIASILLSNRTAYVHATVVALLLGALVWGEHSGVLAHYHLAGFVGDELIGRPAYVAGVYGVIVSTLYIAIFMATSIVNRLREEQAKLSVANRLLEEKDRLKSQYVQKVSHDILSPLSTIQEGLQMVLGGYLGAVSDEAKSILDRAEKKNASLFGFVKNLLDLSRMRVQHEWDRKRVACAAVIGPVAEQFREKASQKDIRLTIDVAGTDEIFSVDAGALGRVFFNLLHNAVKYTPAGGRVSVRSAADAAGWTVEVQDTGIGVPAEEHAKIFDDFYRASNAKTVGREGSGLGLSIVKQIVEDHGGRVWLESAAGQGTRFFVFIPRPPAGPPPG